MRSSRRRRRRSNKKVALQHPTPMPVGGGHAFSSRVISGGFVAADCGLKISTKTFNYICSLVRENLLQMPMNLTCMDGTVLSVGDQITVALKRLSSGESLLNVGKAFGLSQTTVSNVTWRFVEAMEDKGRDHIRWPNQDEIETIKCKFERISGFMNCCGAIDTTHIQMTANATNDVWLDQENNHSMVLQAIVDADMRFRDIITGLPGSLKDANVLQCSGFYMLSSEGSILNGRKRKLSDGSEARECITGDLGFPLLPWLITPYHHRNNNLSKSEAEFNHNHFATRVVAKRALARLKNTWKILQGVLWRPDRHRLPRIIFVCCLLHNIIIDMGDEVQDDIPLAYNHDPNYGQQICDIADDVKGSMLRERMSFELSKRRYTMNMI